MTQLDSVIMLGVFFRDYVDAGTVEGRKRAEEALHAAVDSVTEFGDQGIQFLTNALATIQAKMAAISMAVHNGEYDFD
ncbi:MAG: hypothetical protein AAFU38_20400, partial [Bacteroidota bacterium]